MLMSCEQSGELRMILEIVIGVVLLLVLLGLLWITRV